MKRLILLCIVLCLGQNAMAYPIPPRPLRKLIMESQYIIVGHVIEVVDVKSKDAFSASALARIEVVEVLQGKITESIVEVYFTPNMVCPAPARYKANTDVLAFLNKGKNGYTTHALSYGEKTLPLPAIAEYKERILEMQQILTMEDKDQQFVATVEWLVKCAEHESTRWEGTFELSPESDFMSYYSRSQPEPFQYMLSADQKQRLKTALLSGTDSQYCDFGLVDLVYPGNEDEIYQFLLKGLKETKATWIAGEYMQRLMYKRTDAKLAQLAEDFDDIQFEYEKEKERVDIITKFVAIASRP